MVRLTAKPSAPMLDRVACNGCTLTIGEPPPAQGRLPLAARIGSGVLALGALSPHQRPAKSSRTGTHAANGPLLSATHRCQVEQLTFDVPRLPLGAAPMRRGASAPRASRSTLSSASSPLQEGVGSPRRRSRSFLVRGLRRESVDKIQGATFGCKGRKSKRNNA